jgi:hypothetical protein
VRPTDLRSRVDLVAETGNALKRAFPDSFQLGKRDKLFVDTNGFGDRTCEFVVDGWLIDIPRTALTLARSPRMVRKPPDVGNGPYGAHHSHLSGVLIERFLEACRLQVGRNPDIANPKKRFFYGSPKDIVAFLHAAPDERPSIWD